MAQNPWKKLLKHARLSAMRHGGAQSTDLTPCIQRTIDLTWEDLQYQYELQEGRCYWLGIPIDPMDIFKSYYPLTMSVDRLDNVGHYTVDNVVIACRFANLGRGKTDVKSMQEVIEFIKIQSFNQLLDLIAQDD